MRDAHHPRLVLEIAVARMAVLDKVADLRRLLSGQALPPLGQAAPSVAASAPSPAFARPPLEAVAPCAAAQEPPPAPSARPPARGPNLQQAVAADPVLAKLVDTFDATPTSE